MAIPPVFDEIQIRAKCTNEHDDTICLNCDDDDYIYCWVKVQDLLHNITIDGQYVELGFITPTINY